MNKCDGFTLIEMLIVLTILYLIIIISVPLVTSTFAKVEEKQFLNTFQSDVLYLQNISIGSKDHIRMMFREDHYEISNYMKNRTLIYRDYPDNMSIDARTMKYVSFNDKGSIRYPGVIHMETALKSYRIVFPLGKGRFYVDE